MAYETKTLLLVESDKFMFLLEEDQEMYAAAGLPLPGVTKSCLALLTNSALVIRVQMRGERGVAGSQPMSTAVHITSVESN